MFGVCLVVFSFRLYNQSCEEELYLQSGPSLCCTLDNVPLIRSVRWSRTSCPSLLCPFASAESEQEHCPIVLRDPCRHIVDLKRKKASEENETFLLCVCVCVCILKITCGRNILPATVAVWRQNTGLRSAM